jgi:hypothetical protein
MKDLAAGLLGMDRVLEAERVQRETDKERRRDEARCSECVQFYPIPGDETTQGFCMDYAGYTEGHELALDCGGFDWA